MLIMVTGAVREHKLMVEDHADAEHETRPSGHGEDLGFRLIPEWTFLEKSLKPKPERELIDGIISESNWSRSRTFLRRYNVKTEPWTLADGRTDLGVWPIPEPDWSRGATSLRKHNVWTELKSLMNRRIRETNFIAEEPRCHRIWGQRREWSLVSFDYPSLCSLDINEEPSMFLVSTFLNYDVPSIMLPQH